MSSAIDPKTDPLEQEANRAADRVLSVEGLTQSTPAPPAFAGSRTFQRTVASLDGLPPSVHATLSTPGTPLEPPIKSEMENLLGYDLSNVRLHVDEQAGISAQYLNANAYTFAQHVVFASNRFAPTTPFGKRLIAHELTHVIQQGAGHSSIQREPTTPHAGESAKELVKEFEISGRSWEHDTDALAVRLRIMLSLHLASPDYIQQVVHEIGSDEEDNVSASFVKLLSNADLQQFSTTPAGLRTLDVLYDAMITGDVSDFEKEQAERVLIARARHMPAADYLAKAQSPEIKMFPIKFMRAFSLADYAAPEVELLPTGDVRIEYPVSTRYMDKFRKEMRGLPDSASLSKGLVLPPDEVVGIKSYEDGGKTVYLPAIALIDYGNQAVNSTGSKIISVAALAAALGPEAFAAETSSAARTLAFVNRVVAVTGAVALFVEENSEWIIDTFGDVGRALVKASAIAKSLVAIYDIVSIASSGYQLVTELQNAWVAWRRSVRNLTELTEEDLQSIEKIDEQMKELVKEVSDEAVDQAAESLAPDEDGKDSGAKKLIGKPQGIMGPLDWKRASGK